MSFLITLNTGILTLKEWTSMRKVFASIITIILLISLCSCESIEFEWGGFKPSAKQTIDSSSSAEELLSNASTIAMYSQAYDFTDAYSPYVCFMKNSRPHAP